MLSFSYKFNDTLINDSLTLKAVIRMFMDFDLINKFNIPHKVKSFCIKKTAPLSPLLTHFFVYFEPIMA